MGQAQSQDRELGRGEDDLHHCAGCDRYFSDLDTLNVHRETCTIHRQAEAGGSTVVHEGTRCDVCDGRVEDSNLDYHQSMECVWEQRGRLRDGGFETAHLGDESLYRCVGCERSFPNLVTLEYHVMSGDCGRNYRSPNDREASSSNERGQHVCQACQVQFATANGLRYHETICIERQRSETIEEDPIYHCNECDTYFGTENEFLLHLRSCDIPPPPKKTSSKSSAKSPVISEVKFGRKPGAFECPVCIEVQTHLSSVPCGHLFCTSCIRTALKTNRRCPVCRSSAKETDLRRIFLYGST